VNYFSSILILFFVFTVSADDHSEHRHHEAHEHGTGQMNVAIDGNELLIEFEFPANDIVGFEHKPSSDKQKLLVEDALGFFKIVNSNVLLSEKAKCKISKPAKIETELVEDHDDHSEEQSHDHDEEMHSEFEVNYSFICSKPEHIESVKVLSFIKFKGIKKLKAQGVTSKGQFSTVLSPKSPMFNLGGQ